MTATCLSGFLGPAYHGHMPCTQDSSYTRQLQPRFQAATFGQRPFCRYQAGSCSSPCCLETQPEAFSSSGTEFCWQGGVDQGSRDSDFLLPNSLGLTASVSLPVDIRKVLVQTLGWPLTNALSQEGLTRSQRGSNSQPHMLGKCPIPELCPQPS